MNSSQAAPDPFQADYQALIAAVNRTYDAAQGILNKWAATSLDQASPSASDPDDYVRPMLTVTELLRRLQLPDALSKLYLATLQLIDDRCASRGIRLHRGAVYANFAIAHLERGLYSQGIAYLHAAAQEDRVTHGAADIYATYALSPTGIFGQWLEVALQKMPAAVSSFLSSVLPAGNLTPNPKDFCLWLAGLADLRFPASLVEYAQTGAMTDPHSASVRLECIRDLAALFEVLSKRLGSIHVDPVVKARFADPPALAGLICHMHFGDKKDKRRKNPALNANKAAGLLWNSVYQNPDLLTAIDDHIDFCGDGSKSVAQVWQHLSTTTISPDAPTDSIAKRFLLAYRLRNETAHTFNPLDPGIVASANSFFEWLLEANLYLFISMKQTNQV